MDNRLLWAVGAIILIAAIAYHQYSKKHAVDAAIAILQSQYRDEVAKQSEIARKNEWKLQEHADRTKEQKDEQIKKLSNKLSAAISELRNRPSRSDTNTQNPGDSKACTGAELFREDAEFLAREAARADGILVERDYYYEQYESVRRELDKNSTQKQ